QSGLHSPDRAVAAKAWLPLRLCQAPGVLGAGERTDHHIKRFAISGMDFDQFLKVFQRLVQFSDGLNRSACNSNPIDQDCEAGFPGHVTKCCSGIELANDFRDSPREVLCEFAPPRDGLCVRRIETDRGEHPGERNSESPYHEREMLVKGEDFLWNDRGVRNGYRLIRHWASSAQNYLRTNTL